MNQKLAFTDKLNHLSKLFDDESQEIQKILREEILNHALEIVLNKEKFMLSLAEEEIQAFNQALKELHNELVLKSFGQLLQNSLEEIDLEKSILVLSFWNNPDISCIKLKIALDRLAEEILNDMPHAGHPLSFLDHINRILFDQYHFRGNSADYYNPDNSFIDKVLETGRGIPITLSILYMLVARRLNFPVFGVCMPAHFILKFDNGEDEIFFDPFYGGKVYSYQTCLEYLRGFNIDNPAAILHGCGNLAIVKRVLRNLQIMYSSHTVDHQKVSHIERILNLMESVHID